MLESNVGVVMKDFKLPTSNFQLKLRYKYDNIRKSETLVK